MSGLTGGRGAAMVVFGYGSVVHVLHVMNRLTGHDPYDGLPAWLVAFFYSLTVLDPIVLVLLLLRPAAGWMAGCLVLLCDSIANGIANYPPYGEATGVTVGRVGQAVVTLLAISMLISIKPFLRALSTPERWQ